MLRWFNPRKAVAPPVGDMLAKGEAEGNVTDDPLAVIDMGQMNGRIYSVSRTNPLFIDTNAGLQKHQTNGDVLTPPSRYRTSSSGYGSSQHDSGLDQTNHSQLKSLEQVGALLEQNPLFVKSIRIATRGVKSHNKVPSPTSSSGGGTLTTIPEGKVDLPVPKPIWPLRDKTIFDHYDSLVDDALLLYTSFSSNPEKFKSMERYIDLSVKDLLLELVHSINETLEGKNCTAPEEMLKIVNDKICLKLDILKHSTEEEMKRLCVNLSNCRTKKSVLRALSNSSSSGKSFTDSSSRMRTSSSEMEEIYQVPSGSSSSGFSDSLKESPNGVVPVFVHEDLSEVPNVIRNAMIYGTLCRTKPNGTNDLFLNKDKRVPAMQKKSLLKAVHNDRPSVWEQYYGVRAVEEGEVKYAAKPTDVPIFPGGRPEADFTLDLPRSEHLMKRMRKDKRWRCRCRLLTSFLGFVFFLLSVMAVSLLLTRGKRMFGSMV